MNSNNKIYILQFTVAIALFFCQQFAFTQVDSLQNIISGRNNPSTIKYKNKLSHLYIITGEYGIALKTLVKNLGKIEKYNANKYLASTYKFLGFAHRNSGNLEKARYYFDRCINVVDTVNELSIYHTAISEIGNILTLQEKYDQALTNLFRAKKRFKKLLLDIACKETNVQHEAIKNKFEEWKGHAQQTDDVLVFGLKP